MDRGVNTRDKGTIEMITHNNDNENMDCLDRRDAEQDRRKCSDCESHPDMEKFKTQVKTGVLIIGFFLIYFMGLMSSASNSQANRGAEFEKEMKISSDAHKQEVQEMIDKINVSVESITLAVRRMETAINTLVKVSEYERGLAHDERERTYKEIENIKKNGVKNSTRE